MPPLRLEGLGKPTIKSCRNALIASLSRLVIDALEIGKIHIKDRVTQRYRSIGGVDLLIPDHDQLR